MRFSTSIVALAVPLAAYAAPVRTSRRQLASIDTTVLQFANVLEALETQFYQQGLSAFQESDYTAAGFSSANLVPQQITNIQSDESTHLSTLQSELTNLGATPLNCSYNFDSVLTDVPTMLATARVVENLGVAAYLGAATLITDPQLLEAAASIMTVEARHQTMLNVFSGTGTAIPASFDIGLTPEEVLATASQFIVGDCNTGLSANPTLTLTNTGSVGQGTALTFSSSALNSSVDTSNFSCQMLIGNNPFSISLPFNNCVVPNTVNGPVALFITSDDQPLQNNVVNRASANNIVAGPAMAFIDASPEVLGELVLPSSVASASNSTDGTSSSSATGTSGSSTDGTSSATSTASDSSSTETISPAAAESILSSESASATATGSAAPSTATSNATSNDDSSEAADAFRDLFTGTAGAVNVNGWASTLSPLLTPGPATA